MRYRRLDANGDMTFGGSQSNFLLDREAVAQACKTRLLLFLGEWWENRQDGLPLWRDIIGKRDQEVARRAIHDRLQQTEGVRRVANLQANFDRSDRKFSVDCWIDTVYGPISFNMDTSEVL